MGQNFKKIMWYMKSEPSNLPNCKILQMKTKKIKFETKNALFGYFWAKILKTIIIFNSATRNLPN